uniref:SH3 domain-containing protein n=1 Tax=Esox lucius TaxID=8010 RepID=A0A6Q2ZM21_ESOLU
MWKSAVGHNVSVKVASEGDDWETDPDFENDVSEQEQRWGAKTIEGSGRKEHISVAELRQTVSQEHEVVKKKELSEAPKASYGYGGKFGVEKDRMDKGAMGHGYVAQVEQHSSQTDAKRGFGGKFGVQKDRVDKAALGYDYKGETEKHQSQKDYSKGFGGKFGVEKEKVDKAALGYDYKGETEKHESQKDYAKGFGGRYGVQKDRMDKSAVAFTDMESPTSAYEKTLPLEASSEGAGNLKARFENLARSSDEENRKRAEEERARRQAREKREQEEARRREAVLSWHLFSTQTHINTETQKSVCCVSLRSRAAGYMSMPDSPLSSPLHFHILEIPLQFTCSPFLWCQEEESDEEQPPCLPPRYIDQLEEETLKEDPLDPELEDEGEYEDISPTPLHAPQPDPGQCSTHSGREVFGNPLLCCIRLTLSNVPSTAEDNDYEDLTSGQTAVAIYDYQGEADDEISFYPDDVITNIEMIDEGWWKGQCHGRFGLFPATFVRLIQ